MEVDLHKILEYIQQTVLLLGQALNTISYHRRYNALSVLMSSSEAKTTIKGKGDIMGKSKTLLGKEFQDQFMKSSDVKKKTMAVINQKSSPRNFQQPFQHSPSPRQRRGSGGPSNSRFVYQRRPFRRPGYTRGSYQQSILIQQLGNTSHSSNFRFKICASSSKKPICQFSDAKSTLIGTLKTFPTFMEKTNQRPKSFIYNRRIQNTSVFITGAGETTAQCSNDSTTKGTGEQGSLRNAEEGCNICVQTPPRPILKQFIFSGEKGRRQSSCHKLERVEQIHTLPSLQDGRFTLSEIYAATGRLHVQTGFKRRILFGSITQALTQKSTLSMFREIVRISLPLFWLRACPEDFHKNSKSTNISIEKAKYNSHNLLRRYACTGQDSTGDHASQGHNNLPVTTSRFCNKPKEVSLRSMPGDRIFRDDNKFEQSVNISTSTKTSKDKGLLYGDLQCSQGVCFRIDQVTGSSILHSSSSVACPTSDKVLTTDPDPGIKSKILLPATCNFGSEGQKGANVVDTKFKSLQWEVLDTASTPN